VRRAVAEAMKASRHLPHDIALKLARDDATSKKQPDPILEADYRGIHGYEFQKMIVGNIGSILIVTNKGELGKSILDRHLDSKQDSLLDNQRFQKAWSEPLPSNHEVVSARMLKAFVDIDALRQAGIAKDLLREKNKEFPVELILGGVLASLSRTPFATGELRLSNTRLAAHMSSPYEKQWTQESRTFFVGPESNGYASNLVEGQGVMASVSAYRDIAELWRRAGDLFDQKVNDQLAQADSTLTTLFSGNGANVRPSAICAVTATEFFTATSSRPAAAKSISSAATSRRTRLFLSR
jgi:hypothetical protein